MCIKYSYVKINEEKYSVIDLTSRKKVTAKDYEKVIERT